MKKIILGASVLMVFASCLKQPDTEKLSGAPIVATKHDVTANFDTYNTYYMSDSVVAITSTPNDTVAPANVSGPIISAIATNMQARGFTRVTTRAGADLAINVAVVKVTSTVVYYPYYWGYGYYGGYYPYYSYGYTYNYTTGSMLIDIGDLKNISGSTINIVWSSFSSDLLVDYSTSTNVQNAVISINQAFTQSPYLKTN